MYDAFFWLQWVIDIAGAASLLLLVWSAVEMIDGEKNSGRKLFVAAVACAATAVAAWFAVALIDSLDGRLVP